MKSTTSRTALTLLFVVLTAVPASAASQGHAYGTKTQFDVKQFFAVHYNFQSCPNGSRGDGGTAYKLTGASIQWTRLVTNRKIASFPTGKSGLSVQTCSGGDGTWSHAYSFSTCDITFNCAGDQTAGPNKTPLSAWSYTTSPYTWNDNGGFSWGGGYLQATIKRNSDGVTLGTICGAATVFGNVPVC